MSSVDSLILTLLPTKGRPWKCICLKTCSFPQDEMMAHAGEEINQQRFSPEC